MNGISLLHVKNEKQMGNILGYLLIAISLDVTVAMVLW